MLLTGSRAAVLCIGGWGLQTMLHLWPRLRFVQEERYTLGIAKHLPDLNYLAAFAALLPEPVVAADVDVYPFHLVRPNPHLYPPPFYVDEHIAWIDQLPVEAHCTATEKTARHLFAQALRDHYLVPLPMRPFPHHLLPPLTPDTRRPRLAMFHAGIASAEHVARSLIRAVVDPTRADHVQPQTPMVQTNIYVVASLAEPLASALIWPIVSELVTTLGSRQVVRVTALLATGSFALDDTNVIEEAASYATLRELEALTGIHPNPQSTQMMQTLVQRTGKPGWMNRVGQSLFTRMYLLDREKINQSLAQSPFELAVLTANAIEAFLIADGAGYIEQQLGQQSNGSLPTPYSLIGAASDYIPLAQYVVAAVQEEQKRITRETVLNEPASVPQAHLRDLQATPQEAIRNLLNPRIRRRMFEAEQAQQNGKDANWLPILRVARRYIFPHPFQQQLRDTHHVLWRWRVLVEERTEAAAQEMRMEIETRQFEEAWGLQMTQYTPDDHDVPRLLTTYQEKTWAARHQKEKRIIPAAIFVALQQVVRDICASPNGLQTARMRLDAWIDSIETVLDQQCEHTAAVGSEEHIEQQTRRWQQAMYRLAGQRPRSEAIWIRATLVGIFAFAFLWNWIVLETPLTGLAFVVSMQDRLHIPPSLVIATGLLLTSLLFVTLVASFISALYHERVEHLQQQRLRLSQLRLSVVANQIVHDSLSRVYQQLLKDIRELRRPIQQTIQELETWATPLEHPTIPPPQIEPVHLHRPQTSREIWQHIRTLVEEEKVQGKTGEQWIEQTWKKDGSKLRNWQENGDRLAQRVRLALELPLNQQDMAQIILLEVQRRLAQAQTQRQPLNKAVVQQEVEADLHGSAWCGFASAAPNQKSTTTCTACLGGTRYGCAFSDQGIHNQSQWSLAAIIREYIQQATGHLIAPDRIIPGKTRFLHHILTHYGIETLLFSQNDALLSTTKRETQRDFTEELIARAKPSASYDLAARTSYHLLEVEFGVLAEGTKSPLRPLFKQRNITLLSSYDPMSLAVIRTVHGLSLIDLTFVEREATEFFRLNSEDRQNISLIVFTNDVALLYGTSQESTLVAYERILD